VGQWDVKRRPPHRELQILIRFIAGAPGEERARGSGDLLGKERESAGCRSQLSPKLFPADGVAVALGPVLDYSGYRTLGILHKLHNVSFHAEAAFGLRD
jgi:hypothetical protein